MPARQHTFVELEYLSQALDGSGDDLPTIVAVVTEDLIAAVQSFTGLLISLQVDGEPVVLGVVDSATARTSMLLPLPAATGSTFDVRLILYAAEAGAFTGLAADVRRAYGLSGQVEVDRHLPPPPATGHAAALTMGGHRSVIDQALGVLLDEGYPLEDGRLKLASRAAAAGIPTWQAAEGILDRL